MTARQNGLTLNDGDLIGVATGAREFTDARAGASFHGAGELPLRAPPLTLRAPLQSPR